MPPFIPGLKLAELFFYKAVQPIIARHLPQLAYSAARLEDGLAGSLDLSERAPGAFASAMGSSDRRDFPSKYAPCSMARL